MRIKKESQLNQSMCFLLLLMSFCFAIGIVVSLERIDKETSRNEYCMSCHIHSQAASSWKLSSHNNNRIGVVVDCVNCHLPPKSQSNYWPVKMRSALKDFYSYCFKDPDKINWEQKSQLEYARRHTFNASCIKCHENLFPLHLSKKGDQAHFYYKNNQDNLQCINCHLSAGHGTKNIHNVNTELLKAEHKHDTYEQATDVNQFVSFKEKIPGTSVTFDMLAIQGGFYNNNQDEIIKIGSFFMGKIEVSWDEYRAFLRDTETEGRIISDYMNVDAISGPTPPFGDPSQGWGMGMRPAITMTWNAANTYCKWLSFKTGKKYRLPGKYEWLYACNAGSNKEFFWGENLEDVVSKGFLRRLFKKPSDDINKYVIWKGNSNGKTGMPEDVLPNDFGLINMIGNVKEFCFDTVPLLNESKGVKHVIMGGSFKSTTTELLLNYRDHTQHEKWLVTDPQIPKSKWWYSDCNDVGFRVVCEWNPFE
ncbi:NapC/NirT family cytochrome c [Saccharicrinis sp. GN24d3]|uniref:NapC/NirT family cytochrome c n=1 Tax=Saccharicrinis sp. GN24d3 TaxID=3458416 RepID=UPI004035027D